MATRQAFMFSLAFSSCLVFAATVAVGGTPPSNDDCANATLFAPLGYISGTVGTTNGATLDVVPICDTSVVGPGVWFSIIGNGHLFDIDTCFEPSWPDHYVSVFCGDCTDLHCVGQHIQAWCLAESNVRLCTQAGVEYLILVHDSPVSFGNFTLTFTDIGPCTSTDPCQPAGFAAFCDATDGSLASCPCSNPGSADAGCDIAQATGGVGLSVVAQETSPQNRVTMLGTGFPPMSAPLSVLIRASSLDPGAPVLFGDGLRCIDSTIVRLTATSAAGGQATHTAGHGAMAGSGDFYYQLWFRNTPASYCTPAAFNLSNGRVLIW